MKSYKIIICVLACCVLNNAAYSAGYYLAPPKTPVSIYEFEILKPEEINFFNAERISIGRFSMVNITISNDETVKSFIETIIAFLIKTKSLIADLNKNELSAPIRRIFMTITVSEKIDTSVREMLGILGFTKEFDGKFCLSGRDAFAILQQRLGEIDTKYEELVFLIASYEMYQEHEKEVNALNEREEEFRECIEMINQKKYNEAASSLILFYENNYGHQERTPPIENVRLIVEKRLEEIDELAVNHQMQRPSEVVYYPSQAAACSVLTCQ